jgi:Class III cytochrome C family
MYKLGIGVVCFILALIFGNAMVVAEQSEVETMCIPMGKVQLEPPESVEATRPLVEFNHPTHFTYSCQTCHHQWEYDEPIQSCKTAGCHDGVVAPTKAEKGEDLEDLKISYYKNAYHKLCITCHKDLKQKNLKLELSGRVLKENLPNPGPTGCKECHVPE